MQSFLDMLSRTDRRTDTRTNMNTSASAAKTERPINSCKVSEVQILTLFQVFTSFIYFSSQDIFLDLAHWKLKPMLIKTNG